MLSKKTKYALKALSVLASSYSKGLPVRIAEIAKTGKIPKRFLEAILIELKRGGILESNHGRYGGYSLKFPPEAISLAKPIRLIEGPISPTYCVSLNFYGKCNDCENEQTCLIRPVMLKVRDAKLSIYENLTLQDLLNKEDTIMAENS
jgi:Rrf2 family protein